MSKCNRSVGGEAPRKQITCKRLSKGRTGSNAAVNHEPPLVFDRRKNMLRPRQQLEYTK